MAAFCLESVLLIIPTYCSNSFSTSGAWGWLGYHAVQAWSSGDYGKTAGILPLLKRATRMHHPTGQAKRVFHNSQEVRRSPPSGEPASCFRLKSKHVQPWLHLPRNKYPDNVMVPIKWGPGQPLSSFSFKVPQVMLLCGHQTSLKILVPEVQS